MSVQGQSRNSVWRSNSIKWFLNLRLEFERLSERNRTKTGRSLSIALRSRRHVTRVKILGLRSFVVMRFRVLNLERTWPVSKLFLLAYGLPRQAAGRT
jgi:hypothetical protein